MYTTLKLKFYLKYLNFPAEPKLFAIISPLRQHPFVSDWFFAESLKNADIKRLSLPTVSVSEILIQYVCWMHD